MHANFTSHTTPLRPHDSLSLHRLHIQGGHLTVSADSRESCPRPPCLPTFSSSLSYSPFSHFTHLQPDRLFNCHSNIFLVKTSLQLQQRECPWQRAYQMRPTVLETPENDRDRNTLITGKCLHVHSAYEYDPGKSWMPSNQINATSACAHVFHELHTHAL